MGTILHYSSAPTTPGTLSGTVTSGGMPLTGVSIAVPGVATGATVSDGTYSVAGITPNTYNVTYSRSGYVSQTIAVSIAEADVTTRDVELVPATYTIIPDAGANGTITPSAVQTVHAGESSTFAISADPGYHIADVMKDDVSIGASSSVTFASVDADHTIRATFSAGYGGTYTLTPTAGANGSISPNSVQTVDSGASMTFSVTAATGYHIEDVMRDGASIGASSSVTFTNVTSNHSVAATFAPNSNTNDATVWRFRNKKLAATYLWTASAAERNNINATMGSTWQEEGVAFEINTANPLNKDPLWRFLKTTTWTYFFTATEAEKNNTIANLSSMWGYEGAAFSICLTPQTTTIWRFRNASTNTFLFTGDVEKALVIANNPEFALEGPAFWIAP